MPVLKAKKIKKKKEYAVVVVFILLFTCVSYLSLSAIQLLRGNARVVNYVGIVRGATQKLIKKELYNVPDDVLIARLDSIIENLISGIGQHDLIVLRDATYLDNMNQVKKSWTEIKNEITLVRNGKEKDYLFELSEAYFNLVDKTVSSAEFFSEVQVNNSTKTLIGVNCIFIALLIIGVVFFVRSAALKKRAETLGKIAYLDTLTQMPNRAACEREIDMYIKNPPKDTLAVFMFDMNNLKKANDLLGHQGGDRLIAEFARIIKTEVQGLGFIGRYGGDEFLALFPAIDESDVQAYLTRVNEKIISYNLLHINEVEKISFAVGYVISAPNTKPIQELINESDAKMYERKRQMKENKD